MATKDQQLNRPQSQHRLSLTSTVSGATPARGTVSRHHSHSASVGSINSTHRVTRRKSTNASSINNVSAVKAALKELSQGGSTSVFDSNIQSHRRSVPDFARKSSHEGSITGVIPAQAPVIITHEGSPPATSTPSQNARPRARRASEGAFLSKGDSKRASGELRCEQCGKGYKHSSCLTKHLWEHDPAWAYTSKLLISKHQQVQLLEAASVLVTMNGENAETADLDLQDRGDSSASPAASGSSEVPEDYDSMYSSAETTPPPMSEQYGMAEGFSTSRNKRHSGMSSTYSRSYQSAPSGSLPASHGFSQYSSPTGYTSGISGEEESGLAAAVETLCSFGTPKSGPLYLPADVPPVPPLPARYLEQAQSLKAENVFQDPGFRLSSSSYAPISSEREVRSRPLSQDYDHAGKSKEDHQDVDEGVFGSMEGIAHEIHQELSHV